MKSFRTALATKVQMPDAEESEFVDEVMGEHPDDNDDDDDSSK